MLTKHQLGPYPDYFNQYINLLPETDIWQLLHRQPEALKHLLQPVSEEAAERSYAPGKWSIKEVIGHMMDTERIFAYRCLCISRNETQPLPGFDENDYIKQSNFNQSSITQLLEAYSLQRQANIAFYSGLSQNMLGRIGIANNQPISVKALVVLTAAHELHHLHVLKERYLTNINKPIS